MWPAVFDVVSIVLCALVAGMFVGPWLAVTRSIATFSPEVFLAVVGVLNRNMAPLMTALLPAALLSTVPVLVTSYGDAGPFVLTLAAAALFVVALLVTVLVEVPIVARIVTWTVATLPSDWQRLRDRWGAFHIVRVGAGLAGFVLLVTGVLA